MGKTQQWWLTYKTTRTTKSYMNNNN